MDVPMNIDFETAVRTLVWAAMGEDPHGRVTVGLIVAVLARKFSVFTEEHIAGMVARIVLEEGGNVDHAVPIKMPFAFRMSA
jgi:hypothetical protein